MNRYEYYLHNVNISVCISTHTDYSLNKYRTIRTAKKTVSRNVPCSVPDGTKTYSNGVMEIDDRVGNERSVRFRRLSDCVRKRRAG